MCRQWEILEYSFLNRISVSNPSPQSLGIYVEEEVERLLRTKVNDSKETVSCRHNRADAHMNSQTLWKCLQYLHRLKTDKILAQKMSTGHEVPPLTKLFASDPFWEKEISVLQWSDAGETYPPHFRAGLMIKSNWATEINSITFSFVMVWWLLCVYLFRFYFVFLGHFCCFIYLVVLF